MSRLRLFSAVVCAVLVEQASAGAIQTPECIKEMSSVNSSFQETLGNLAEERTQRRGALGEVRRLQAPCPRDEMMSPGTTG